MEEKMNNDEVRRLMKKYKEKFGDPVPIGITPATREELREMILESIRTGVPLDDGDEFGY